jgi:hypothetical protein
VNARPRFSSTELRVARVYEEQAAASADARVRAVRVVASRSTGVDDCRELLDMLGLHDAAGLPGPAPGEYVDPGLAAQRERAAKAAAVEVPPQAAPDVAVPAQAAAPEVDVDVPAQTRVAEVSPRT